MMTFWQQLITIGICAGATQLTRHLPFWVFSSKRPTPKSIEYLGKALPAAVFGMLVVYCIKNVDILSGAHGIPEAIGIAVTCILHLWRRNMMLSIAGGTICYMMIIHFIVM